MSINFQSLHQASDCKARVTTFNTGHGPVTTPVFMPVGTIGTVKTLTPADLLDNGTQVMLSNTYHLYLRPGTEILESFGGLHKFNQWSGPILTDSGGFQIYSLDELKKISEEGVEFKSHWDGSKHLFTPENVVDIQRSIGSDIMMVLDYLTGNPSDREVANNAHLQTIRWAERARRRFLESEGLYGYPQQQFGIVQGGVYDDLRRASIEGLVNLDFEGYAIGGLAVGEDAETRRHITDLCTDHLPREKARYLMGVGKPEDILDGIELGVDMFDCVIPSRNARNGSLFTASGRLNIRNASHKFSDRPIDADCDCHTCRNYPCGYLHHMFRVNEMLGFRLATVHNIYFYMKLTRLAREAIENDQFMSFKAAFLERYRANH